MVVVDGIRGGRAALPRMRPRASRARIPEQEHGQPKQRNKGCRKHNRRLVCGACVRIKPHTVTLTVTLTANTASTNGESTTDAASM